MKISHSYDFGTDFVSDVQGNGSISVTGGVLRAAGTAAGDRALKFYYLHTSGYTRVKVSVMARAQTGKCFLGIDASASDPNTMSNLAITETSSKGWTLLELDIIIPMEYGIYRISFGRTGSDTSPSEVYLKDVRIEVDSRATGSNTTLVQGLVRLQNGVASIRPSTKSFGFGDITYNAATKEVSVGLSRFLPLGDYAGHPVIQVSGTHDSFLVPLAGGFSGNKFIMKFSNGAEFVDISDKTVYVYIRVAL